MIETQFDTKVRVLQTDWEGEFQAFTNTLCKFVILHKVSCLSTSQQNALFFHRKILAQEGLHKMLIVNDKIDCR